MLHLDIMDGSFVPNLSFGPGLARRLAGMGLPLDIHLMVSCLDWAVPAFAQYAHYLTVHAEATPHLHRVLQSIRERGCRSGVALNPSTPPDFLPYVLDQVDLILVMTVNPGWGSQEFILPMMEKVARVKELVEKSQRPIAIEVDGGVTDRNASALVRAGADILVSGSYIFSSADRTRAVQSLRESKTAAI